MTRTSSPYETGDAYAMSVGVPSVEVFRRLRTDAGLSDKAPEAVALALPNTWHGVVLHHEGEPIGMGADHR